MNEQIPKINSDSFENYLKVSIENARSNAMPLNEYNETIVELRNLRQKRLSGLSQSEEEKYQLLKEKIDAIEIFVPSIMEYKKVLELLDLPQEKIDRTLNHENAHANMAEQLDSKTHEGFRVRFCKDEHGEIHLKKSAKISTDLNFPEKQILEEDILVNEAPFHAGDKPSKRDQDSIDKLKDKLSKL